MFRQFFNCVRSNSIYEHIDWQGFSEEQKNRWLSKYALLHRASKYLLMSNSAENYPDSLKCCMEGLTIMPDNPALLNLRRRIEKDIFNCCAKMIESDRTDGALSQAECLMKIHPKSAVAWMIRSLAMQKKSNMKEGLMAAVMAVRLANDTADTHFVLGSAMFNAGNLDTAVTEYTHALRLYEKQQKFAIYNHNKITETLTEAYTVCMGDEKTKATSEGGILGLSGGFTDIIEDTTRSEQIKHR
jgi:tetratricopeptide (TPR) repeat protein